MRVGVLGPLEVDPLDGALGPRDRMVLTALVIHRGEAVSGDRLADALWGDDVPPSWNKVVQGCIVRLRKALGPGVIETLPTGYRLAVSDEDLDAAGFERALERARELLALGEPERAMYATDEALRLWRGRPLVDAEGWEPARIEAHRLEELRREAEELRLDAALRAGRHREVLSDARACVGAAPTRERRWELLALAQYRSGHQGDALRTLHEARAVLATELGVDPGPDLVALERAVLQQDPALVAPASLPEVSATCPWPGLLAYGVGDAREFFGRSDEVRACLDRLATEGVLVVVGASGSGKSSLVRAGVAASLQRAGRRVVIVTPGTRHPTDALSAFDAGSDTVLIVDQCEEAVAPSVDVRERERFFVAIVEAVRRGPVVLVLRADRLGEVSAQDDIARIIERGLILVGPMAEAQVRDAIEGPARGAALLLEPGLVDLVVRDVLDEPGALPLMSHSLRQTWLQREGRTMTVAAYRESGGIRGAVAQSAEALYAGMDADDRTRLRELLLRLVSPLDSGEPARARVARDLLAEDAGYEELVEVLVAARLLTSDGDAVEVAHEALARAWPRLRDWLEEDVDGVRVLRHLSTAAAGWGALGRPASELYRGVRLAQAIEWHERDAPALRAIERDFLEASVELQETDIRSAEARVAHERRTVRRLRRLLVGAALLAAVAVTASVLALVQQDRADDQAQVATARRLSAQALVATPRDRALLLAVEAVRRWDSRETRGNLLTTIGRSPQLAGVVRTTGPQLLDLTVDAEGRAAAVTDALGRASLYDLETRREIGTLSTTGVLYQAPTFDPSGARLALGKMSSSCWFGDCAVMAVDVFDGGLDGEPTTYTGLSGPPSDVVFSPDGELLAAAPPLAWVDPVDNIAIWRLGQPDEPLRRFTVPDPGEDVRATPDQVPPGWVAFSPDGTQLYASGAGPIVAFDVATGRTLQTFTGLGGLAISDDGSTLAVRQAGHAVDLVDASTGATKLRLEGHDSLVTAAAFSRDGAVVATTSTDETVVVWDTVSGARVHTLAGHSGAVMSVAISADGSTLYSSAADRSVFMWDVAGGAGLARPLTPGRLDPSGESSVLLSPAGDSMLVASETVSIVDIEGGGVTDLQIDGDDVAWAAFAPDGAHLATVGWDGATTLFATDGGKGDALAATAGRGAENYGAIAFTADGEGILVGDADGIVVELDAETLDETGRTLDVGVEPNGIRTAQGGRFAVTSSPPDTTGGTDIVFGNIEDESIERTVHIESWGPRANFSADGAHYAVGGSDGRVAVITVDTGRILGPRDPVHAGSVAWMTFSPDGSTLASMGFDGDLVLSDGATATPHAHVQPGPLNTRATIGYSPDGHTMLVGYQDGAVLAYETDSDAWIAHACRVAGRNLTADEWRDAVGDREHRRTCPDHR